MAAMPPRISIMGAASTMMAPRWSRPKLLIIFIVR
jgi:hypothetical protein